MKSCWKNPILVGFIIWSEERGKKGHLVISNLVIHFLYDWEEMSKALSSFAIKFCHI